MFVPQASPLYKMRAESGSDFMATRGDIIIPDGATVGQVPVAILPDLHPELPELFTARLRDVRLLDITPTNPSNLPRLGDRREATVTIASNDDANGVFSIYSIDPRAQENGQLVLVEEREKLAVELIVERQGEGWSASYTHWAKCSMVFMIYCQLL